MSISGPEGVTPSPEGGIRTFKVDASGSVRALVEDRGEAFATSRKALEVMARDFGKKLPENPRVLVLNPGELCHTEEAYLREPAEWRQYLPTYRPDTDTIVHLPKANEIGQHALTQGIARAFAKERFERRNHLRMRVGAFVAGLGVVTAGVGYGILHNPWVERPGYALTLLGLDILPQVWRNRQPAEPDIKGYVPPIWLARSSDR